MDIPTLIDRAHTSAFARWKLNFGLRWSIPFNRPHGFRVVPGANGAMRVEIPFRRANRNHIRGIHACCLATAAELCSGLALIGRMDPKLYRIIMMDLHMDYHWQAKANACAVFNPTREEVQRNLYLPLQTAEACLYSAVVHVHDVAGNHLATGRITWQVKRWEKVRTRV